MDPEEIATRMLESEDEDELQLFAQFRVFKPKKRHVTFNLPPVAG